MARVSYGVTQLSSPNWLGGFSVGVDARETIAPFGALVEATQFTANANGIRNIPSGTLLGRRSNKDNFEPVVAARTTSLPTTMREAAGSSATVLKVVSTNGFVAGDVITIANGTPITDAEIASVDHANKTITLTEAVGATVAAGIAVSLTTAVDQTDFFLLMFDIEDAAENAEATLCRHGAPVKVDWLPGYAALHADVKAVIAARYQTYTVSTR